MKRYTALATFGTVAVIGAGAVLLPAVGDTGKSMHTLKFTAVTQKSENFGKTSFGQDEIDRNKAGKIIGFDVINGSFDPATNSAKGWVTLSAKGGVLYGKLKFSNGPVTTGTVTGGTGRFKGVSGTIYGKNLNKSGSRTAVTIKYH